MCYTYLFVFLFSIQVQQTTAVDKITTTKFITDPEALVSSNGAFKLGFFSPPNSTHRYVGIMYNKLLTSNVVWVANRNNPLNASSGGAIKISEDGNLRVLNARNQTVWFSNISISSITNKSIVSEAQLLDSGNLVLMGLDGMILWQSFKYPTDTALPNMKLTVTKSSDMKMLQAWNGPSDPSYGRFSVGIDSFAFPQLVIFDGDQPYWRSGPWNGHAFTGIQYNETDGFNDAGFILENDRQGTISITYSYTNESMISNYGLSYQGTLSQRWWDETKRIWKVVWEAPHTKCDIYGKCGAFGSCDLLNSPICRCLKGFKPRNYLEWSKGNWTNGCMRKTSLQCGRVGQKEDGFFRVKTVKVPDNANWLIGLDANECRNQCLQNCSCIAYVLDTSVGCMTWDRDLIDIEKLAVGGVDLHLRLTHSELAGSINSKKVAAIAATGSLLGAAIITTLIFHLCRWHVQNIQGKKLQRKKTVSDVLGLDKDHDQIEEVLLYEFEKVATATNNFQDTNKLGRGGFGLVYKGKTEDGKEIAVKRLSRASGQGVEEFLNEMLVISKLQHRNLVRLLGCCVEGEEKMLIYEYMPNKSLDSFLFDPIKQELLPWKKRYEIIQGICQGLLYLHRDSRLKIIHRDLKASNILLDEKLNPKISDFGMSRIFGGEQDQDDTRRVVGTYGYMSPEYAMEGRFSEKSDVFSFGVLLLEIVSGKRNSVFWYEEESLSLLGYAYKLWKENDGFSLIDPAISETCFIGEIQKCIQVGLLCVQESAQDRPNISTVITMLRSEAANLPRPKQAGFSHSQKSKIVGSSSEQSQQSSSVNQASITILSAR